MADLTEIEKLAKEYAGARASLHLAAGQLDEQMTNLKKKALPKIAARAMFLGAIGKQLEAAIEESPELFKKPRTQVMHNIKVGFQKQSGTIEIKDAKSVIIKIRKLFPRRVKDLIQVKETPIKAALNKLPVADCRKLGITVHDATDVVVITAVKTDTDKLVEAFLKEAVGNKS